MLSDETVLALALRHATGGDYEMSEDSLIDFARAIEEAHVAEWKEWSDKPIPEDKEIAAAHPYGGGSDDYTTYEEALRLVKAKHSKYALVDLVNYLLVKEKNARKEERERCARVHADMVTSVRDYCNSCDLFVPGGRSFECRAKDATNMDECKPAAIKVFLAKLNEEEE